MQLPDELTTEAHVAIIACLRIAAARGRALRLAREQAAQEQKAQSAELLGSRAADLARATGTAILNGADTDATQ